MDVKLVDFLGAAILPTSPFGESLITARRAVWSDWGIRIGAGCLWSDEAVGLRGM
jgi:hypothetical protein